MDGQRVSDAQRPALMAAESGRQVGRLRAEHLRDVEPAPYGEVVTRAGLGWPYLERTVQFDALSVQPGLRFRAADRHERVLVEGDGNTGQGRLQRGREPRVSHELVRQCKR